MDRLLRPACRTRRALDSLPRALGRFSVVRWGGFFRLLGEPHWDSGWTSRSVLVSSLLVFFLFVQRESPFSLRGGRGGL